MKEYIGGYFDIDNTLKKKGKPIDQDMIEALSSVPLRGINSLRSITQVEKVVPDGVMNLPTITQAGSEVWQTNGEILQSFSLSSVERDAVTGYLMDTQTHILLARFYPSGMRQAIVYAATDELEDKYRTLYSKDGVLGEITRSKSSFAHMLEKTETAMITLKSDVPGFFIPESVKQVVDMHEKATEVCVTKMGVNKGTTLLWLCQEMGFDPSQMVTAGDDDVFDAEMFRHTYGIGVGKDLLPYATIMVPHPEDLAKTLRDLFQTPA